MMTWRRENQLKPFQEKHKVYTNNVNKLYLLEKIFIFLPFILNKFYFNSYLREVSFAKVKFRDDKKTLYE